MRQLFVEANKKYEELLNGNKRDYLGIYFWGLLMSTQGAYFVQSRNYIEGSRLFNAAYTKFSEASLSQPYWSPILGSWAYTLRLHAGFKQATEQDTQVYLLNCTVLMN